MQSALRASMLSAERSSWNTEHLLRAVVTAASPKRWSCRFRANRSRRAIHNLVFERWKRVFHPIPPTFTARTFARQFQKGKSFIS
jgi:hypothetical protein